MLQDHIHLDTVLGGAENAPIRTWTVIRSTPVPHIIDNITRDLRGRLVKHQLTNGDGRILLWDHSIVIKLMGNEAQSTHEKIEEIAALAGATVYFVDNNHTNDGEDHTDYVKTMYLRLVEISPLPGDTNWQGAYVEIELTDDSIT